MVCDNWRSVLRPPICGQSTSSDVCQIQQATRHADNPLNCTIKSTPNTKKIQQSMIPATRVIQKSNIKRISKFQLYTKTDSSGVHALDFDDAVELHVAEQRTRQFLIFFPERILLQRACKGTIRRRLRQNSAKLKIRISSSASLAWQLYY